MLFASGPARLICANAAARALFAAADDATLAQRLMGPGAPAGRRLRELAESPPPESIARLERLRFFARGQADMATLAARRVTLDGQTCLLLAAPDLDVEALLGALAPRDAEQEPLVVEGPKERSFPPSPAALAPMIAATPAAPPDDRATSAAAAPGVVAASVMAASGVEATSPAIDVAPATAVAPPAAPPPAAPTAAARFVWASDAEGRFASVGPALAQFVGASGRLVGRSVADVIGLLGQEERAALEAGFAGSAAWSAPRLAWPVEGTAERAVVDFSGAPVFDRARRVVGYRGFGVVRPERLPAPVAAPVPAVEPPAPASQDEAPALVSPAAPEAPPVRDALSVVAPLPDDAAPAVASPSPADRNEATPVGEATATRLDLPPTSTAPLSAQDAAALDLDADAPADEVAPEAEAEDDGGFAGETIEAAFIVDEEADNLADNLADNPADNLAAAVAAPPVAARPTPVLDADALADPVAPLVEDDGGFAGEAIGEAAAAAVTADAGAAIEDGDDGSAPVTLFDAWDEPDPTTPVLAAPAAGDRADALADPLHGSEQQDSEPQDAPLFARVADAGGDEPRDDEPVAADAEAGEAATAAADDDDVESAAEAAKHAPATTAPDDDAPPAPMSARHDHAHAATPLFATDADEGADEEDDSGDETPRDVTPAAAPETGAPARAADAPSAHHAPPAPVAGASDAANVVPLRPHQPALHAPARLAALPDATTPGPVDASPRPVAGMELSAAERNAFREIARSLGARPIEERGGPAPPHEIHAPQSDMSPAPEAAPTRRGRDLLSLASGESTAAPEPPRAPPTAGALMTQRDLLTAELARNGSTMLDRLPVGLVVARGETALYANRTLLELVGFDSLEAFRRAGGVGFLFRGREPGRLTEAAEGGAIPLMTAEGEALPVDARVQTLDWEGAPATLITIRRALDAETSGKMKALELELRARQIETRELHAMLDTATDGVAVLDGEGRILALNRSAEALFGYEQNEVAGEHFAILFTAQSQRAAIDYLEGLKSNGVASVLNDGREAIGRERQGGAIPLFMTIGRVGAGDPAKFCAVLRDMTHWKKAERQLDQARRDAERASALKSDFLAKISHEIRTPLNAIIGFAEVIMEERFGPVGNARYKDYLKDIHASGSHVMSLVNDLLDLSKIESGKLDLVFGAVDANRVVTECVSLMQPQALGERVILRVALAPRLPQIVADERSLRQIVLNLLSNAVKFNEAGGQVIVSTALTDAGHAVIRIRDTGIGMSEDEIEIALEPFRQIATARPRGGTGLGLPLTKALVEANRASFSIKSRPREGTLVEIAFPPTRVLAE